MMRLCTIALIASGCFTAAAPAQSLLKNGSFEAEDPARPGTPAHWTAKAPPGAQPLAFSPLHYEGGRSAMIEGDGQVRMWRQDVIAPDIDHFKLSAFVKAEDVIFQPGEYAYLYGHILYKDQPYADATHFFWRIRPGTNDWLEVSAIGKAVEGQEIDRLRISVTGKFSHGRIYVDQLELTDHVKSSTPAALLQNKLDDLREQLQRIGPVDDSVPAALAELNQAAQLLTADQPQLEEARQYWVRAAERVSPGAWAAMFPAAMSDRPVEAQMLYHGLAPTQARCDAYLDMIEKTGCNGVLLSLGSWMSAVYHSDMLPVTPGWEEFDALSYFIDAAHQRGIKVYGYLAVFNGVHTPTRLPGNLLDAHPGWFAQPGKRPQPVFPDPAHPEAIEFIAKVYAELATRYKLDGIGLDYVRYPTLDALNFDERNRQAIQARYGFDIMEGDPYLDPQRWPKIQAYRADMVDRAVRRIREAVREVRPDVRLFASLFSDPAHARGHGQDWTLLTPQLDYASPMNYSSVSTNEMLLANQRDICRQNNAVFIPAIGGMPQVHQTWTISEWARRVAIQRRVGCDGIIIYRIGDFDPAVAAFFGNGPFRNAAAFPEPLK